MGKTCAVAIPTYNAEATILRTIRSVRESDEIGARTPIYVYDNCSEDKTLRLVQSLGDPGITVLGSEENRGFAANLKRCLTETPADFVAFLCADDSFRPGHLRNFLGHLEKRPDLGFYFSDYRLVFEDGSVREVRRKERPFYPDSLYRYSAALSSFIIRREGLAGVPADAWTYRNIDWFVFIYCTLNLPVVHSPEPEVDFYQIKQSTGQQWLADCGYAFVRLRFYDLLRREFPLSRSEWAYFVAREAAKLAMIISNGSSNKLEAGLEGVRDPLLLRLGAALAWLSGREGLKKAYKKLFLKFYAMIL